MGLASLAWHHQQQQKKIFSSKIFKIEKKWQLKNQKPQRVGRLQSNEDVADLRDQPNLKVEEDQKVVLRKQRTQRLQRPQKKRKRSKPQFSYSQCSTKKF